MIKRVIYGKLFKKNQHSVALLIIKLLAFSLQLLESWTMYVESFKELIVWQKSIRLVKEVYRLTHEFPPDELYILSSQMRRCAISIPSNIAEGKKRGTKKDFVKFLIIADASAAELETQIIIAKDLHIKIDYLYAESLLEEVQKMLITMINKLKANS